MTAPVSIFHVEPSSLPRLRDKIVQRKNELVMQIASGNSADWPDYKQRIGRLQGIDEALAIIDEMEKHERN